MTAVVPGDHLGVVTTGIVGISHPAVAHLYFPGSAADGARLLNMGQVGDVDPHALRRGERPASHDGRCSEAALANPIAQNVVLMKAQYGVDCLGNGVILWTSATASNICGDGLNYTPDDFVPAAWPVGCVVCWTRAEPRANPRDPHRHRRAQRRARSQGPTALGRPDAPWPVRLLDAQRRLPGPHRAQQHAMLTDGFRHRTYETIVPMLNAIYNNGL